MTLSWMRKTINLLRPLLKEGETFLETVFPPNWNMQQGKQSWLSTEKQISGGPGAQCYIGLVVEDILSNEALKQDKVSYRPQQLWLEAAGPLVACLEKAHKGNLSLKEAIPMLQSSLMLMGDALQHQSARQHSSPS